MGRYRYIFPVLFALSLLSSMLGEKSAEACAVSGAAAAEICSASPDAGLASGEAEISVTSNPTTNTASSISLKNKAQKTWASVPSYRYDGLSSLTHIVEKEHSHPLCDMRLHRHIIFLEKILI